MPDRGSADSRACVVWHPRDGVFRSDDGGRSWQSVGLAGRLIMAVTASPADRDVVWVGTEPSEVWRSGDAGNTWEQTSKLETLSSSSEWSFPPRPDTHHVRWIACHPLEPKRLWVAIEAGALVSTIDGGRTWSDRVPGGPWDTHQLAIHHKAPDTLRVSAGDGYFESDDAGATWRSPTDGLEVGYLRSWRSMRSNRRSSWYQRRPDRPPRTGWPLGWPVVSPSHSRALGARPRRLAGTSHTIAPLLCTGAKGGELWAADERGVTVRMMAGRVGAARWAMPRPHSIYAASRWCSSRRPSTGRTCAAPWISTRHLGSNWRTRPLRGAQILRAQRRARNGGLACAQIAGEEILRRAL